MTILNGVKICEATNEHQNYAEDISKMISRAAENKSVGLALRTPDYIRNKILEGKAVIALFDKQIIGFCYIELWDHTKFIANSGLIVVEAFREIGLASEIKKIVFELSRKKYPNSKVFGLTTNAAVMKINSSLGYRPVIYNSLTADTEFWEGCKSCANFDILQRTKYQRCLCTAMLFNPFEFNIEGEEKLNLKSLELIS